MLDKLLFMQRCESTVTRTFRALILLMFIRETISPMQRLRDVSILSVSFGSVELKI